VGRRPDGSIHRSVDKGRSWERQGQLPGSPAALLVDGTKLYAAVAEEGIFHSDDGGRTWQLRYRDPS
jgi:photosystem II stability/assembly factor-like uncharacterized protein